MKNFVKLSLLAVALLVPTTGFTMYLPCEEDEVEKDNIYRARNTTQQSAIPVAQPAWSNDDCGICLGAETDEPITLISQEQCPDRALKPIKPCHTFHTSCITLWLQSANQRTCPACSGIIAQEELARLEGLACLNFVREICTDLQIPFTTDLNHLLCQAASQGRIDLIARLVGKGANLHTTNDGTVWQRTPLMYAWENSKMETITYLLESGADINQLSGHGQSILEIEFASIHLDIPRIKTLIEYGANPNHAGQTSLLHITLSFMNSDSCQNQTEIANFISWLLEHHANPNITNNKQETPLIMLSMLYSTTLLMPSECALAVARLLLDRGADVNALDCNGKTALRYALCSSNQQMAELLLSHNATKPTNEELFTDFRKFLEENHNYFINFTDQHDSDKNPNAPQALLLNAISYKRLDVIKALVTQKINLNIGPRQRAGGTIVTPLQQACMYPNLPIVKYLLKHGANVNSANRFGTTPLHEAVAKACYSYDAAREELSIIQTLLAHSANPALTNNEGKTPLHIVAEEAFLPAKITVMRSYNPDGETWHDHETEIPPEKLQEYCATANTKNTTIIKLLLSAKAPINVRDAYGRTALSYILENDYEDLAALLRSKGATE